MPKKKRPSRRKLSNISVTPVWREPFASLMSGDAKRFAEAIEGLDLDRARELDELIEMVRKEKGKQEDPNRLSFEEIV